MVPIMSEDLLLGAITAGFLSLSPQQTHPRIITAMGDAQQEDVDRAFRLYEQSITPMIAPQEQLVTELEFISSYLAQSYHAIQQAGDSQLIVRQRTNTEEIFRRFWIMCMSTIQKGSRYTLLAVRCIAPNLSLTI